MSKTNKTGGKTSTDKTLEDMIGGEPLKFTISVTTKYLSNLEKLGAVVNGEPVPHKDFVKKPGFKKLTTSERSYLSYLRYKGYLKEAYLNNKNWDEVIASVFYSDVDEAQEALIDYVGEVYNTKVKDAKHLQELTGITQETLKTEANIEPGKETTLERIIIAGRYSKYSRELTNAIAKGFKYNQLLKLEPGMFRLPETWEGNVGDRVYNKYTAILWAIVDEFALVDMGNAGLSLLPSLRAIANELEAPYSVLMDAFNTTHKWTKLTFEQKRNEIGNKVRVKFPEFIKAKGKAWRKEWLLEDTDVYEIARKDIETDYVMALSQVVLKDMTGKEAKCGGEIEQDVREYFKEELTALQELILNTRNGDTGSKKEVYRAES